MLLPDKAGAGRIEILLGIGREILHSRWSFRTDMLRGMSG
jgi:hypothetical protein